MTRFDVSMANLYETYDVCLTHNISNSCVIVDCILEPLYPTYLNLIKIKLVMTLIKTES